ncbi:MAG: sulfotransferase [Candidatus Thermoplasmatota archaeon]|nr:sulfotransferase [Candidatus Thermoplasmatota archaeon]
MGWNPEDEYLQNLEQVSFTPVFILGVHRSGTSILYKMLTATESFNPVTAYHLLNYHELLTNFHLGREAEAQQQLTESFHHQGLTDRGIDQLGITADFAEEYGFLLNTKTTQMYLTDNNSELFIELCKKIQYIAQNQKPLLLKNPYDLHNFLYLKQRFPHAKFVFIHRHPLKTISSTLAALQLLLKKKNPYTAQLAPWYRHVFANPLLLLLYRFCFLHIPLIGMIYIIWLTKKSTRYYLNHVQSLPKEDYVAITYEELCVSPQHLITRIMRQFSLPMTQDLDVSSMVKPRTVSIHPQVFACRHFIMSSLRDYCQMFQYSSEEK